MLAMYALVGFLLQLVLHHPTLQHFLFCAHAALQRVGHICSSVIPNSAFTPTQNAYIE